MTGEKHDSKMLADIEEDRIDKSVWLPPRETIFLSDRILKGDMDYAYSASGRLRYANAVINSLMNFLSDREKIHAWCKKNGAPLRSPTLEYEHVGYGQTYEILQAGFCAQLGFRNSSIYYSE